MRDIDSKLQYSRGSGNTTWLLESAIDRPDCVIVAYSEVNARRLKERYDSLLSKRPFWFRVWRVISQKGTPRFVSVTAQDDVVRGEWPVVFDNGAIILGIASKTCSCKSRK